ncbi:hypothetical protein WN944_025639 [Citrus x changshan-huyou]|uniref:EF-hand domain-containing protein n=1 Tax=Citrus x changshan-huyou TaxID=2935761 RepID=A0AAP0QD54_9ROSI
MEALSKVALAYYNSGTDEERRLFNLFFLSMDQDGNRRVSYREFSNFMSLEAHDDNMRTRDFFNQLDIDRSGGLDFKEVLTLYYILKSGRPICGQCKIFITNEYFTCMSCFEPQTAAYSICLECFCDKGRHDHNHGRSHFVDNFSSISMNQRSRSESSSHVAIARNNANIPAEGMSIFRSISTQGIATSQPDHSGSPSIFRSIRTQGIATSQPDHSGSPSIFRSIRTQGTATSQPEHSERPLIFRSIRTPTSRPDHSESPSNLTVIPYNSNTPAVGRVSLTKL